MRVRQVSNVLHDDRQAITVFHQVVVPNDATLIHNIIGVIIVSMIVRVVMSVVVVLSQTIPNGLNDGEVTSETVHGTCRWEGIDVHFDDD